MARTDPIERGEGRKTETVLDRVFARLLPSILFLQA